MKTNSIEEWLVDIQLERAVILNVLRQDGRLGKGKRERLAALDMAASIGWNWLANWRRYGQARD